MLKKSFAKLLLPVASGVAVALFYQKLKRQSQWMDFQDRVVVITGGSRGLGLILARLFAEEGARLALLAREEAELERAAEELESTGTEVMALVCDVSQQIEVEKALGDVIKNYGQIDVLINNAGIIQVGPVEQMTPQDFEDALAVHFWGPFYTIKAVYNFMQQQGGGRIVNISSVGGAVAVPHLSPYTASKFALTGLSDAMRAELAKDNIQVTTVIPGLMRTGSHVNALFKGIHLQEFTWFSIAGALPLISTDAEDAARQIIEACRYGSPSTTITLPARALVLANTLFPNLVGAIMQLTNRFLPNSPFARGFTAQKGIESQSSLSPSALTAPSDEAALRNNEIPVEGISQSE